MDVIALVRAGLEHAVAPLGTAMTAQHLEQLWRVADAPVLALDGDDAGRAAALRAVDLAVPLMVPGKTLRVALLPPGQDPDDVVRGGGAAAMQSVLDESVGVVALLWRRETEGRDFSDPDARAALDQRLRTVLARFGDDTVRAHYREALFQKRRALFRPEGGGDARPPFRATGQRRAKGRRGGAFAPYVSPEVAPELRASPLTRGPRGALAGAQLCRGREAAVLLAMARRPALLDALAETLAETAFEAPDMEEWRRRLLAEPEAAAAPLVATLEASLPTAAIGFAAANATDAAAELGARETLARLGAEATRRREVAEAEQAMADAPDPALARRLSAAATLDHRQSAGAPIESDDDEAHLTNALRAAISAEIWKKKRRGGGPAT
jgi:DNA primase